MKSVMQLIGGAIALVLGIAIVVSFFAFFITIIGAMILLFLICQAFGIPVSVTQNGRKIGELKFFKFRRF